MGYINTVKKIMKGFMVALVNLEPHQYTPEIGAMITIVEQADVPALTHHHQKI